MNILHLVGGLGTSSGTTQIIWNLCRVAADEGHNPSILYLTNRGIDTWTSPDPRIRTYPCPVTRNRSWGFSPAFHRTLKELGPYANVLHVHSNWLYINLSAAGLALRHNVPLIISPQGALDPWCLRHHAVRKFLYWHLVERRLMETASAIHVVSDFEHANVHVMNVHTPCHVIPNGASVPATMQNRQAARRLLNVPDDAFVVLFLARLNPKKGLDLLLRAASEIPSSIPLHLLIAGGDGGSGYRQQLARMATPLEQLKRITWLGQVSGDVKTAAFAAANVYCLPSHAEGMPVSVLEAMAHGCPVLISDACHIPEVESAGAGFLIERSPEAIRSRILELARNPAACTEMSANARTLVDTRFNWTRIGRDMLSLYSSLQNNSTASQ